MARTRKPVVEVRRSQRRRRTVSAYRDGERVVVLIPDRFSRAEETEWVERMLAPASRKLGWHPDFAFDALLPPDDLARAQFSSVPPLGLFTLVRLPN